MQDDVNAALNAPKPQYGGDMYRSRWSDCGGGRPLLSSLEYRALVRVILDVQPSVVSCLAGWCFLRRLLSQSVRLLPGRIVSTYHSYSIFVQLGLPSVSELFFTLRLRLAITYLQFYPLTGSQHLALQVERSALLRVVLVE